MEALLHHVWKFRLFDESSLKTPDGTSIEIIDPGIHNSDSGPDFFNSKLKIGGQLWAGNVEIHIASSDWIKHRHEQDKAYNSVILHVVQTLDLDTVYNEEGRKVLQLVLQIPPSVKENFHLLNRDISVPCASLIPGIPRLYLTDWQSTLATERLESKTRQLLKLLDDYKDNWNEVFYITLSRNFGFGINNDIFERLSKSLPLRYVMKHRDSVSQVEALFFGQAGLLEEDSEDNYFCLLKNEYRFLQKKYRLKALDSFLFRSLHIRPWNFPHIKIAQLAEFVRTQEFLFSKVLESKDLDELEKLFIVGLHDYWLNHYHFSKQSVRKKKQLGLSAIRIILINTVVPILFAYGEKNRLPEYKERAIRFLEQIKPENNSIVTFYVRAGMQVAHAGDSQALIQLKREYCEKKKCLFCRIGYKLLSGKPNI